MIRSTWILIVPLLLLAGIASALELELPNTRPAETQHAATQPAASQQVMVEAVESTTVVEETFDDSDDIGPLLIAIVLLIVFAVLCVVALVVVGVAGIFLLLLILLGILSISVTVGIAKRSMGAGFRSACALLGAAAFSLATPAVVSIAMLMVKGSMSSWIFVLSGCVGLAAGAGAGYFIAVLIGRMLSRIVEWFRWKQKPEAPVAKSFPVDAK